MLGVGLGIKDGLAKGQRFLRFWRAVYTSL